MRKREGALGQLASFPEREPERRAWLVEHEHPFEAVDAPQPAGHFLSDHACVLGRLVAGRGGGHADVHGTATISVTRRRRYEERVGGPRLRLEVTSARANARAR